MNTKTNITGKTLAWLLTLIYFASYVTRINFAAIIQEVVTDTGYEKSALSIILVCLSITYGLGQIVNGWLGDRIKPSNLIFCGLILATVINLIFPLFAFSVPLMTIIWGINGFAQAMMWPPIVKILVANCDDAAYNYAVVRVSWGSSIGTIVVYLAAPLIIGLVGWKGVFVASAVVGLAVTLLWALIKSRVATSETTQAPSLQAPKERFHFPRMALFPIVFVALGIIFQGMLRDGVTSWMPTYLAEVFDMGNQASIFCTVALAFFSLICHAVSAAVYKRFFSNEVVCGGVIFGVSALSALLMFFFFESGAVFAIIAMAMITGCMHGVNLMLITHVPKRFKKYGNISTIAGAINACTYVGAAISTYGIALLSEKIGWQYTVGVWFLIALVGTLCCFIAARPWHQFMNRE